MTNSVRLRKIPESALHVSKPTWWLESRFHFSFADWYDRSRMNFGALRCVPWHIEHEPTIGACRDRPAIRRVVNDDLVQPRAGFGTHPHTNAEIFSYVVRGPCPREPALFHGIHVSQLPAWVVDAGELTHADSMGNRESLPRGCVQFMSAGSGVTHSEMNDGSEVCRFLQVSAGACSAGWGMPGALQCKPVGTARLC